jgi:ABC-type antimicrobial peptide transport system permease subunit
MVLTLVLAGVAFVLAVVGIYGVLAWAVSQRINEIGVRMSLGAHPRQVRRMIVIEGATLLVIGLAIGAVASLFASRVVEGMLYGVTTNDPTTLVAVAVLMGAVGVIAAWVPAMRASSVQPVEALRSE